MKQPDYYKQNGFSPIDAFREGLISETEYIGFLKGNVIKYTIRAGAKDDAIKDLSLKRMFWVKIFKTILELFDNFKKGVYNTSYEWGAGICCNGSVQNTFSSWLKDNIYIGDTLLGCGKNKGIKSFIHSHPFTTSPLASTDDYLLFAFHKIKYGIVTNEFGTMVIKSKSFSNNLKNWEKIKNISKSIEQEAIDDFEKSIIKNNGDPNKLSENEYNRKFHIYVRNNHNKYYEKYQTDMRDYFTIKFINPITDN